MTLLWHHYEDRKSRLEKLWQPMTLETWPQVICHHTVYVTLWYTWPYDVIITYIAHAGFVYRSDALLVFLFRSHLTSFCQFNVNNCVFFGQNVPFRYFRGGWMGTKTSTGPGSSTRPDSGMWRENIGSVSSGGKSKSPAGHLFDWSPSRCVARRLAADRHSYRLAVGDIEEN